MHRASNSEIDGLLAARPLETDVAPAMAHVQTVYGCPLACVMCSVRRTIPRAMETSAIETLEPYLGLFRVLGLHAQGEPLLGDLEWIAAQARFHGFVIHMNTTGSLLSARLTDTLAGAPLSIRFSIHAARAETYERVMGQAFEHTIENIRRMTRRARESCAASEFWFSFIVMRENIREIEDIIRLAADCGIEHVRFMRLQPHRAILRGVMPERGGRRFFYFGKFNRGIVHEFAVRLTRARDLAARLGVTIEPGTMPSSPSELKTVREIARAVARKASIDGDPGKPIRRRGTCVVPWVGQLQIDQQLDAHLCCASDTLLGNLKSQPLEEIWNGPRMRGIRASFRDGTFPRACGLCPGIGLDDYPGIAFRP